LPGLIVIIGAGPAGLSVGYHLKRDYLLIERERRVGGLCRSFTLDESVFDLGGHAFFTKHDHVRQLVGDLCAAGLYEQDRRAFVHSHGVFLPYPFQSNLFGLPDAIVRECLAGAEAAAAQPAVDVTTLDAWVERAFGPGVARHFLRPYNEKVWAHPLDDIVPTWTGDRIVAPSLSELTAGAHSRRPYTDFPNARVSYPASGGFEELYLGFEPFVAPHLRRGTVERVLLDEHVVVTTDGDEHTYDELVSTMPLTELVRAADPVPEHVRTLGAQLVHNSLLLVNLVVRRPAVTEMQRVYSADPSVPFHKLVVNSNSSAELRAGPHTGLQAEVSYSPTKPVEEEGLVERVVDDVRSMGIIDESDSIAASSVVRVPLAYPVATRSQAAVVDELRAFFAARGVHLLGRFGEWAYINSDEAVHRGRDVARRLSAREDATRGA
jgi:protoporphyrinogen oxidase